LTKLIQNWRIGFSELSLAQKSLLLIGISMILQLITLIGFFLSDAGDPIALKAGQGRLRSHAIRQIVYKEVGIMLALERSLHNRRPIDTSLTRETKTIEYWGERLHQLPQMGNSDDTLVKELLSKTSALIGVVNGFTDKSLQTTNPVLDRYRANNKFIRLEKQIQDILNGLVDTKDAPALADKDKHEQLRNVIFLLAETGSFANLVALLVMAFLLHRPIVQKLAILEDNCSKIARGQISYTPMTGNDEVAILDQALHKLTVSLTEAANKQRSSFDTGHDVMCYLTEDSFCFTSVNKAAINIFQIEPEHLRGATFESVIHPHDRAQARKNLQSIVDARSKPPFEMCSVEGAPFVVRVSRSDGTIAHTMWTIQYIPSSHTLFCVVHDFTDQISAQNARKEIAQMVNHDLRSPLNAIRVIYSILGVSAPLTEAGHKSLVQASANTDRMLRLINELLDIEKIEAGQLALDKRTFNLNAVVETAIQAIHSIAEIKEIEIENNGNEYFIDADDHRIVQVLVNLLSNAVKFSPKGGTIKITSQKFENYIEVTVADDGRGIPESLVNQIFDRFQQVKKSDASLEGGSGLGLSICKSLIELHGGTIGVHSEVGRGSRFFFRIPC
jgi:PAS domain S-box-containing protein